MKAEEVLCEENKWKQFYHRVGMHTYGSGLLAEVQPAIGIGLVLKRLDMDDEVPFNSVYMDGWEPAPLAMPVEDKNEG